VIELMDQLILCVMQGLICSSALMFRFFNWKLPLWLSQYFVQLLAH